MPRAAAVSPVTPHRRRMLGILRLLTALLALAACALLFGCSREPAPKVKTPDQVKAEIEKVQKDPKMPANVKAMVLGLLRKELEQSEKFAQKQGK